MGRNISIAYGWGLQLALMLLMVNVIWIQQQIIQKFLAVGGCFQGEAWKRIAFVRSILDSLPQPLRHCDPSWDLRTASAGENYYMIYLGKEIANDWLFELPEKILGIIR